jgi:serine/arginine repetitive matrix protein 2
MYNGIGLSTVRGSATSGHVQKNMSYIKPEFFRNKLDANQGGGRFGEARTGKDGATYKVNKDVIEHNKKHAIEAKVYEFEDSLREEGGLTEEQIEEKVAAFRKRLTENGGRGGNGTRTQGRGTDTHEISARKNEENERLRAAFGIRDNFVSGSSFDPAAQEQRRKDREAERAAKFERNKVDRERRERERDERVQTQAKRLLEGSKEDGRPARERYVPKDRSGEADRERSRSRSNDRGRRVDSRDRKRRRSPSPRRSRRSPDSRSRDLGGDKGRTGDLRRGRGSRGRSGSRERTDERKGRARSASRSPSPAPRHREVGEVKKVVQEQGRREGTRGRSRSRSSSSSGSSRSDSSGSSSSDSRSSSGSSRGRSRSSSRHSRTPQRRSPSPGNSPPRRKTRWGDK